MPSPSATARCARCSSPLVEISIDRGPSRMTMRSCSTCDTRWWQEDGEAVALNRVLASVATAR